MSYKSDFIQLMAQSGVLKFGSFTLKSGRVAPYFINTGSYHTGRQLADLGTYYAQALLQSGLKPDVLFGPAYKGIPLCVTTAMALAGLGRDVDYCFNRKEVKDHGEGGLFCGRQLQDGDKVVITEDVVTSGTQLRAALPLLQAQANVEVTGLLISVDRKERGLMSEHSAVQEITAEFGIPVFPIVTMDDIIGAIQTGALPYADMLPAMERYRAEYGVD